MDSLNPTNFNIILAIDSQKYNNSDSESDYDFSSPIEYEKNDSEYEYDSDDENDDNDLDENIILHNSKENNELVLNKFKNLANELKRTNSHNKYLNEIIHETKYKETKLKKRTEKNIRKEKQNNCKKLKKLLNNKNITGDIEYFDKNLNCDQQNKAILHLEEIRNHYSIDKPYLLALIDSQIPISFKAIAFNKINMLRNMSLDGASGEFYKLKNWVDLFMKIPFNNYSSLPLNINDGIEKSHEFIANAKSILDSAVYGLNDAKMQIMQMIRTCGFLIHDASWFMQLPLKDLPGNR